MHTETAFDDADLNGLVDGRLEPSRAAALAASLRTDPEASARIDAWRRQTDNLRTMFASVLAEPVPVRLLPVAVSPRDLRNEAAAERPALRRLAGVVATTATGAALVGFALGALASVGTDGFGLAPSAARSADAAPGTDGRRSAAQDLATRAAEAHRTFLTDPARPVELTAAEASKLARWIGHRLGTGLRIPDLARQGWSFLGGRIVPGRSGPAAFLAYGNGADRLGLTVSRGGEDGAARVLAADDDAAPLGIATWGDGAFGYALTSDRGPEWLARNLVPLRDATRAQIRAGGEDAPAP